MENAGSVLAKLVYTVWGKDHESRTEQCGTRDGPSCRGILDNRPPAKASGPGFVVGQPGYANLDDFLEALDRTIDGTNESTTPAYLFGRPDSDWVDSNSFLMVTTDAGGNTDVLFLNASDLDMEDALAPSNGYMVDTDDDGTPDSLSQQYYYDRSLGVLQNLTWFSIPMPFANVSTDGLQIVTSAVYAEFLPGKWVSGIRMDTSVQVEFVIDDPELPELDEVSIAMQATTLHPMAYVTGKPAAVSWAQLLANESPFLGSTLQTQSVNISEWGAISVLTTAGAGPEEVFVELEAASVDEYRDAITAGAGIVEESITAGGYTIIDGNGETHYLMAANSLSCGEVCWSNHRVRVIAADGQYEVDVQDCVATRESAQTASLIIGATVVCCGAGAKAGSRAGTYGAAVGCAVGGGLCGYKVWSQANKEFEACVAGAAAARRAAVATSAAQAWACCAACGNDPACQIPL